MRAAPKKTIIFLLLLLLTPVVIFAQTSPLDLQQLQSSPLGYAASVNESDIEVIITPESPGANEPVYIRLDSNTVDLNRYPIQWTVDGAPAGGGTGQRDIEVVAGGYGTTMNIVATISLQGITIRKEIFLSPQDITLLWEAVDSYVPPFYRGKKMPGKESLIRIYALPNFRVNNNSLALNDAIYLWTRNGNRILNIGGYGRDSIVIEQGRLRDSEEIIADVSSVSGNIQAQKTITIPMITPRIHWYTRDNYGYRRLTAIDNGLRVASGDVNLIAEPYFFSLTQGISDLDFDWKIGSESLYLEIGAPKHELVVTNPGTTGKTDFSVTIENPKTFLQTAAASIPLFFTPQ